VIYDPEFRDEVFSYYINNRKEIEQIYERVVSWIDLLYSRGSIIIPAVFASKILLGDDVWDIAMQTRAVAAIFQLLINVFKLPLWVFWGDVELEGETIRLIYIFSSASKVEGLRGRVIICQFSDDDRELSIDYKGKELSIRTIMGGVSVLYTVYKKYGGSSKPFKSLLAEADKIFEKIMNEAISKALEEKVEEKRIEREKVKKELETLDIPLLDEELKEFDLNEGSI